MGATTTDRPSAQPNIAAQLVAHALGEVWDSDGRLSALINLDADSELATSVTFRGTLTYREAVVTVAKFRWTYEAGEQPLMFARGLPRGARKRRLTSGRWAMDLETRETLTLGRGEALCSVEDAVYNAARWAMEEF